MVVVPSTVPRTAQRPGRQLPVRVQLPLRCVRANVADSLFSFSALESGPLFDRQMPGVRSSSHLAFVAQAQSDEAVAPRGCLRG